MQESLAIRCNLTSSSSFPSFGDRETTVEPLVTQSVSLPSCLSAFGLSVSDIDTPNISTVGYTSYWNSTSGLDTFDSPSSGMISTPSASPRQNNTHEEDLSYKQSATEQKYKDTTTVLQRQIIGLQIDSDSNRSQSRCSSQAAPERAQSPIFTSYSPSHSPAFKKNVDGQVKALPSESLLFKEYSEQLLKERRGSSIGSSFDSSEANYKIDHYRTILKDVANQLVIASRLLSDQATSLYTRTSTESQLHEAASIAATACAVATEAIKSPLKRAPGYVGGPTCAMIANKCPDIIVTIVDINPARIAAWNCLPNPETGRLDDLPVYEPGLADIIQRCRGSNLFFSTNVDEAIRDSDLIFVSVNTPTKTSGVGAGYAADLHYVEASTRKIAEVATTSKIIVEKSTVPCRTAASMRQVLESNARPGLHFDILSNPEFLAEGTAISDLQNPDRVLIGSLPTDQGKIAAKKLSDIYARWVDREKIYTTGLWSSELSKLAANALLAQRISSINAMASICEATGADVTEVAYACGLDKRIGSQFLRASVGFGGSCFQKDILNLVYLSESLGLQEVADYWKQVIQLNEYSKSRFAKKILSSMFNTITHKKIAVLGFAFKKDTGDTRETPAATICKLLRQENAFLTIYDPKISSQQIFLDLTEPGLTNENEALKKQVSVASSATEACEGAEAVVITTDWDEFKVIDWSKIYASMKKPAFLFDGRNVVDSRKLRKLGFRVHTVGQGPEIVDPVWA
ncbi:hypothetical protein L7F22_067972 [Adiantum nelumboides]|nr:hypothetical protein [Adiantum nelumboides]